MTSKELKAIEAELERRGYRKYTHPLTSSESWAWFKNFGKEEEDEEGRVISGYQVAFRVWDFTNYDRTHPYDIDVWASPLGADFRADLEVNWEPIADIATFERMAAEFNKLARKFVNPEG